MQCTHKSGTLSRFLAPAARSHLHGSILGYFIHYTAACRAHVKIKGGCLVCLIGTMPAGLAHTRTLHQSECWTAATETEQPGATCPSTTVGMAMRGTVGFLYLHRFLRRCGRCYIICVGINKPVVLPATGLDNTTMCVEHSPLPMLDIISPISFVLRSVCIRLRTKPMLLAILPRSCVLPATLRLHGTKPIRLPSFDFTFVYRVLQRSQLGHCERDGGGRYWWRRRNRLWYGRRVESDGERHSKASTQRTRITDACTTVVAQQLLLTA